MPGPHFLEQLNEASGALYEISGRRFPGQQTTTRRVVVPRPTVISQSSNSARSASPRLAGESDFVRS